MAGDKKNISSQSLSETKYCLNNFGCLKKKNFFSLKGTVEQNIDNKLLFITHCSGVCSYKITFGNLTICHCPVRNELYSRTN